MSEITPSQTVGPFFAYGLAPKGRAHWDPNGTYAWKETAGDNLITPDASGQKIRIEGQVFDGDGKAITDAMLEIWQADAQGRYAFPEELLAVYRHEPLVLEVMFPITYGGIWDYPYPEAQALIESLREADGIP